MYRLSLRPKPSHLTPHTTHLTPHTLGPSTCSRTVAVQMDVDEKVLHRGVERNTAASIIQGLAERLKAVKAKTQ